MEFVKYERVEPHIVVITLNRPERLNAFGSQLSSELEQAFCNYEDDPELRVAILTGAGRAFCAGVDVKEWAERGAPPFREAPRRMLLNEWGTPNLSKPVIAAVRGYCLGAGLNLVLMRCDIRIAGESSLFGMPEVARGVMDITTPFAYQNIPTCFLAELFFTGDPVPAERTLRFGLVNMVVPDEEVMPRALEMARRIARHSPQAVRYTKRNLLKTMEPKEAAFVWENYLRMRSFASRDALEGMRSWVEGREPRWEGTASF